MLFKRKCKITFIAHGATIYTEEDRICDKVSHPPLNEVGQEEAEKIARWIVQRSPKIDKIYTSPSLSCVQTANFIANEYDIDFEISEELKNQDFGIWKGLTYQEVEKKYPDMLKQYHDFPSTYMPENGESLKTFDERVENSINKLIDENHSRRIIVVTHSNFVRAAIRNALNLPIENQNRVFIPTGSASQINYNKGWNILRYSGHVPLS